MPQLRHDREPNHRLVWACGLVPVLVAGLLALYRPASIAWLDSPAYDTVLRLAPTKPPVGQVAIVDVDERSLSTIGQWPWPRDVMGTLIERLRQGGASVIAFDVIFAEPDRSGHVESADDRLAGVLRDGRVVLGYAMTFDAPASDLGQCVLHPMNIAMLQPSEETGGAPLFHAAGAVCALPVLAGAAGASGFLNAAPDSDGILRRVPVLVDLGGRVYPSLALSAVSAATHARDSSLRVANINTSWLSLDSRNVPLDGKGNLLMRFRGKKKTFPYISAADVLNGRVADEAMRGKIVFVGTTALGTREVVSTPLDTLFAGVEVQATVADDLLQQDFFRRPQLGTTMEALLAIVLGLAASVLVARAGLLWGTAATGVALAALWYGSAWLLSATGVFVSPLFATFGLIPALPAMTLAKFLLERRRADSEGSEKTKARRLMVQTLLSLTEVRDAETGRHSRRTQEYARVLSEQLAGHPDYRKFLTPDRIELLSSLAPLHDIGKVGVPDHILNKRGALTPEELVEMRKHPAHGRDVILKAERDTGVHDDVILTMAKDIVYTHHERWDGSGYPQGLRGANIPVPGRVMTIVDVYDAAVSRALYRQPISHDAAVRFIVSGAGTHFDPRVVSAFEKVAERFEAISQGSVPTAQASKAEEPELVGQG